MWKGELYGKKFAGNATASGEPFDPAAMTAAHRTLPFGTQVAVTTRKMQRRVVVTINDRGPHVGGRIIDLSAAAAAQLELKSAGVKSVCLNVIAGPVTDG